MNAGAVQSPDGHELELLVHAPEHPRAMLLFVCALGVEARYCGPFGEALAALGIALAMCDLRGNGTSNLRPSRHVDFGYREIVELDIPGALAVVFRRVRDPVLPKLAGQGARLHSIRDTGIPCRRHVARVRPREITSRV